MANQVMHNPIQHGVAGPWMGAMPMLLAHLELVFFCPGPWVDLHIQHSSTQGKPLQQLSM